MDTIILFPIALILSQTFSRNLKDTTLQSSQNTRKGHTLTCVDVLKQHASNLKESLLCPWMKQQKWETVQKATQELAECIKNYVSELVEKSKSVKIHHQETVNVTATDDVAFRVIDFTSSHPTILKPLVTVLQGKGNYKYVLSMILSQLTKESILLL